MEKLTIGKLANSAGTNLETVRYYERIGLMPEPGRTEGGHRNYAAAHVRRLTFIRRARELGFAIEDIRALLELAEPGRVSCGEVQKIAAHHLHDDALSGLFDEINRVLKAGGTLLFMDPIWAPKRVPGRLLWSFDVGRHPRTTRTLERAIADRFEVVSTERFSVLHTYLLIRAVRRPSV